MSGIYIPNMQLPNRCEDCFCYRHNAEYDYAYCNISSVKVLGHGNARLNHCPLIPVPDHGRLGDLDLVKAMIQEYIEEYGSTKDENGYYGEKWCAMKEAEMVIQDAPTVIEADKEAGE